MTIHINRRHLLLSTAAFAALALAAPALAGEAEAANAVAWLIGDNLSLAGLLYARGGSDKDIAGYLGQARAIAKNISLTIADLPPKGADASKTTADVIKYLVDGDGWQVGVTLGHDYGPTAGTLFEVSVKSNLLLLLYAPGNDSGIGELIKARLGGLLPPNLWQPLLDAIAAKQPAADVQQAVLDMHTAIAEYLVKAAG